MRRIVAVGLVIGMLAAACSSTAAPGGSPAASMLPDPTWCVTTKAFNHHVEVDDLAGHAGDPRAGDPEWIYLEILSNTVLLPGPMLAVEDLDLAAVRTKQEWVFGGFEMTDDDFVLRAGDDLEYRVSTSGTSVVLLIALEAEICLVGDQLAVAFWFAAGDTPAVVASVVIEARVGGKVIGRSDPVTIEIGEPG